MILEHVVTIRHGFHDVYLMNKKCRDEKDTPSQTFLSARSQNHKRLKKERKIDPFSVSLFSGWRVGDSHKIRPQKHRKFVDIFLILSYTQQQYNLHISTPEYLYVGKIMILQYYCILVVLIVHRHKRPSSYFQNEGNCTLSVWPMWKSNWNPSMCNTKICIRIFNLLQSTWTICFAPSFFVTRVQYVLVWGLGMHKS